VLGSPPTIQVGDLPHFVKSGARPSSGSLADMERAHIETVLTQCEWNISRAARTLEVDRGTLYNKIQKYGLKKPEHA
jgi:transcriptional regulator of acetoin/glycerol metabolism